MSTNQQDILRELRRPFPPEAVRVKLQTDTLAVLYIDARLVVDRLNQVCGLDWYDAYEGISGNQAICKLTVCGITRTDLGNAPPDAAGGSKAILSDALKRTAVKFGIGISIYAVPVFKLQDGETWTKSNGKVGGIRDAAERRIRRSYEQWLDGPGAHFGEPLAVGFDSDSAGDLVDEPADRSEREIPEPAPRRKRGTAAATTTIDPPKDETIVDAEVIVEAPVAPEAAESRVAPEDESASTITTPEDALRLALKGMGWEQRKIVKARITALGIKWDEDTPAALVEHFAGDDDGLVELLKADANGEMPSAEKFQGFIDDSDAGRPPEERIMPTGDATLEDVREAMVAAGGFGE